MVRTARCPRPGETAARARRFRLAIVAAGSLVAGAPLRANIAINSPGDTEAADANCTLREAMKAANTNAPNLGCAGGTGAELGGNFFVDTAIFFDGFEYATLLFWSFDPT